MTDRPHESRQGTDGSRHRPARRTAEWVSLGISALLILSIAAYLLWEGVTAQQTAVPVDVKVRPDRTQQAGERYVLPVEVRNNGQVTLRDLRIVVELAGADAGADAGPREIDIDYLGQRSGQTLYLYFDRDPRSLDVRARPVQYRLE